MSPLALSAARAAFASLESEAGFALLVRFEVLHSLPVARFSPHFPCVVPPKCREKRKGVSHHLTPIARYRVLRTLLVEQAPNDRILFVQPAESVILLTEDAKPSRCVRCCFNTSKASSVRMFVDASPRCDEMATSSEPGSCVAVKQSALEDGYHEPQGVGRISRYP